MSPKVGSVPLDSAAIARLTAEVAGPVLLPDAAGYPAECATYNLLTPVRPAVAVGALTPRDVQVAVRFAAERGLPVAVLATGHQVARSAEGSVLINLSRMNAASVDSKRSLARVEGGVRWRRVLRLCDGHWLAPLSGSSPTVGVVGYHLGGGASPVLGRRYGYAADHVCAFEIVTPDGELLQVTAEAEPDLFWAVRGGKGNFGVVTALEFKLFPVTDLYGGGLAFAGEDAAKVLHFWRDWVVDLPEEMSSSIAFLRLPSLPTVPGPLRERFVVDVRFFALRPREAAERALAPVRAIAETVLDTVTERLYCDASAVFMEPPAPASWVDRAAALHDLPSEAADTVLELIGPDSATQLGFVELRLLGGALGRPPAVPNAVPSRRARLSLYAAGGGPVPPPVLHGQLITLVDALAPWTQDQIMPTFLGAAQGATADELRAIYGRERYDRLTDVKTRYDPDNRFCMTHNIKPNVRQ
jgi:FAD/FMN-containing dehydrogenase